MTGRRFLPLVLLVLSSSDAAYAVCGDVNGDGRNTAVDALAVLQSAVGQSVELSCSCAGCVPESTSTTIDGGTTTTTTTTSTTLPPTFAGLVSNDVTPTSPGPGVATPWSYGGMLGIGAGNAMCAVIGADHVCTYAEVFAAETAGELDEIPDGTTFWLHRVSLSVVVDEVQSPPGPGGRCNDWTSGTDHLVDGEYAEKQSGTISYHFDDDTAYDGIDTSHAQPGLPCAGVLRAIVCCR